MSRQDLGPVYHRGGLNNTPRPPVDSELSEKRESRSLNRLEELAQHPQLIGHFSLVVPLLEVDVYAWSCIQYLLKDEGTANKLRLALPQLYQIPDDMANQVEELRADPDWEKVKDNAIDVIAGLVCAHSRPNSRPFSGQSSRSWTNSTISTRSNLSMTSSHTSHLSAPSTKLPQIKSLPSSPMDQVRDQVAQTAAASSSPAASLPPALPLKDKKVYRCPLEGCVRIYYGKKRLHNHMKIEHSHYPPLIHQAPFRAFDTQIDPVYPLPQLEQTESQPEMNAAFPDSLQNQSDSGYHQVMQSAQVPPYPNMNGSFKLPVHSLLTPEASAHRYFGGSGVLVMSHGVAPLCDGPQLLPSGMYNTRGNYSDINMADTGYEASEIHAASQLAAHRNTHDFELHKLRDGTYNPYISETCRGSRFDKGDETY